MLAAKGLYSTPFPSWEPASIRGPEKASTIMTHRLQRQSQSRCCEVSYSQNLSGDSVSRCSSSSLDREPPRGLPSVPPGSFLDSDPLPAATIDIATTLEIGLVRAGFVGVGMVLQSSESECDLSDAIPIFSGNRIPLVSLLEMLDLLEKPHAVTVASASDFLIENMKQGHAHRWRRQGWKNADGVTIESKELWEQILTLGEMHRLCFVPPSWPRSAGMAHAETLALQGLTDHI